MSEQDLKSQEINEILSSANNNISDEAVERVLAKIDSNADSYTDEETAILLYAPAKFHDIIFDKAKDVNNRLYGKDRLFPDFVGF